MNQTQSDRYLQLKQNYNFQNQFQGSSPLVMKKRLRGSKKRKNLTENYTNLNTEADSLPYLDQSL